jgi:hypothetical protein
VYATDLLGYTNFGGVRSPWSWRLWIYISTLRFSDHHCHHYSKAYRYYTIRRVTQQCRWEIQLFLAQIELERNMTCAMQDLQDSDDFVYSVCCVDTG